MRKRRCGFTLMELVVAMVAASVLVAGIAATVFVASQAFESDHGDTTDQLLADELALQIAEELQTARTITELTTDAVTFTVPDRDGDGFDETIRYAFSGTKGSPLTREYNSGGAITVADDVHGFVLSHTLRDLTGTSGATVLFVSGGSASPGADSSYDVTPTSQEQDQIQLMESWNFVVVLGTTLDRGLFDQCNEADVVFISSEVSAVAGLADVTSGIVIERPEYVGTLGLAGSYVSNSGQDIDIVDNTHYVTSPFSTGSLQIMNGNPDLIGLESFTSRDLLTLADDASIFDYPSLAVLEAGQVDFRLNTVAGRRILLPWASDSLNFSHLRDDGQTILQRALEWAAGVD